MTPRIVIEEELTDTVAFERLKFERRRRRNISRLVEGWIVILDDCVQRGVGIRGELLVDLRDTLSDVKRKAAV